jgi:hypothetical protein
MKRDEIGHDKTHLERRGDNYTSYQSHCIDPDDYEQHKSIKNIRRDGFLMAEERFDQLAAVLEKLHALEQEQKAAELKAMEGGNLKSKDRDKSKSSKSKDKKSRS